MTKKIHFILPGGGIRGSFQAGFLYTLFNNYKEYFEIARIDGTSVGSVNGFATILGEIEALKSIWYNIHSINDFFGTWSDNPIIGKLLNLYRGFYNNGVYDNKRLKDLLLNNLQDRYNQTGNNCLSKYSCAVTNMNSARIEYISGTNTNIFNFITASAAPWIITNPMKIEEELYTDGCLLETYPLKYTNKCGADLTIIVGFDQEHINFGKPECDNMFTYLATLIDIARFNSTNKLETIQLIKSNQCIPIVNTMKILITDFSNDDVIEGFQHGCDSADQFAKTYLIINDEL